MRIFTISTLMLLLLPLHSEAIGQEVAEQFIADFEDGTLLRGKKTSHKASVTLVDDVPEGGGKTAVQTAVDPEAGTKNFVGTGFAIPRTNFTKFKAIRFWVKADVESGFNFQCGLRHASHHLH